jgi:hypothetical protein
MKYFVFIVFYILFFILIPLDMTQAALVPCGPGAGAACTWADFYQLAKNIIDFMIYNLVFPISAVMIVVGGIMIMTAGDSSSRVATGKEIIAAAVVGLLIALLSWLIIDTIMKILTNGRLGPWNQL